MCRYFLQIRTAACGHMNATASAIRLSLEQWLISTAMDDLMSQQQSGCLRADFTTR
jgi:hypothetical protein